MPEPTLTLRLSDITGEVGLFLGYGRGADNGDVAWSSQQQAVIDSCVRSGLRQFYFPPPLEANGSSYDWSFLKPTVSLTLASAGSIVHLPDDFGGIEGYILVPQSTSTVPWKVQLNGEGMVRARYAETPDATGRPLMAAVIPTKGTGQSRSQRFDLLVYPLADQEYTLQFAYYVSPDYLTGRQPYAYGGPVHAETILESALSIAEQRLDDAAQVHTMKFKERLAASISMDRRMKPQMLGYNRDLSDGAHLQTRSRRSGEGVVTYNGVEY